jgi:hypothetical protein
MANMEKTAALIAAMSDDMKELRDRSDECPRDARQPHTNALDGMAKDVKASNTA